MEQPMFVGINPSNQKAGPRCTTTRRMTTWSKQLGLEGFTIINCIKKRGAYSMSDVDLDALASELREHRTLIALGSFPSKVLNKINREHHRLPHPSGLNRLLNDKVFEDRTIADCKKFLENT